jgi:glycine/D-amino acid oxidase-like deaminating enzyme
LSDETKKSRKEFIELKNQLPKSHKESQKLWLEGTRGLSEDVLAREFPSTWSRRSRNYSERGRPQLKAGDYSGAYFLPLGGTTSPIEVVRFAWALLKEWCAKEGVDWTGRLDL